MKDRLEIRFECKPGRATPEFALECQRAVIDLLNALADDIDPGAVRFTLERLEWVDDGKDDIVIRVKA